MQATRRARQLAMPSTPAPDDVARVARLGAVVAQIVPPDLIPGVLVGLARSQRGYSQADLARRVGMNRSTLGSLETGARAIRPARAELLAAALEIPVDLITNR